MKRHPRKTGQKTDKGTLVGVKVEYEEALDRLATDAVIADSVAEELADAAAEEAVVGELAAAELAAERNRDIMLVPVGAQCGDPTRLRVLVYGDDAVDLLPYEARRHQPQTRIRLDRAGIEQLIALLGGRR